MASMAGGMDLHVTWRMVAWRMVAGGRVSMGVGRCRVDVACRVVGDAACMRRMRAVRGVRGVLRLGGGVGVRRLAVGPMRPPMVVGAGGLSVRVRAMGGRMGMAGPTPVVIRRRQMVLRMPAMGGRMGMTGPTGMARYCRASAVMIRRPRMGLRLPAMEWVGMAGPTGVARCGRACAVLIRLP